MTTYLTSDWQTMMDLGIQNSSYDQHPHCHFLISTHILEYAKQFEHHPAFKFYYMESHIENDRFICTYRLKEGISESKVGFWIIRKELIE